MAWFKYADLPDVVQAFTCGRQGCVFSTVMFNGTYSIALSMLYSELAKLGLGLRISRSESAFWGPDPHVRAQQCVSETVIDAVFVDDECLVLLATAPTRLNQAIRALMGAIVNVFVSLAVRADRGEVRMAFCGCRSGTLRW